jgi:UDP-N-acetylmuramate dehydrogenase
MSSHTSFKIGGPADFFITLKTIDELKQVRKLTCTENIPFLVIGNGSNLLVRDKGIRGIVAKLDFDNLEILKNKIKVSADYAVSKLARICAKQKLSGIEFLAGIPGTIGGAVRMNAGAYGSEIKDVLKTVTVLDENGNINEMKNEDLKLGYRTSIFKNRKDIILSAVLELKEDDEAKILKRIDEMMNERKAKQPIEFASAGSTFKRGESTITAKLIDECGLKGYRIGGAEVSIKHSGFIINRENATAKDVLDLVEYVKKEVYQRFNEKIELEVLVVGEE